VRRLVILLALVGVLVHAHLVVRHNTTMVAAQGQMAGLLADLGVICHGGGTSRLAATEQPGLPQPASTEGDCPLCSGLAIAAVVLPEIVTARHVPDSTAARVAVVGREISVRLAAVRPPSCGPPTLV
jgi:hypothetical protein